jgi:hypothetical protein
MSNGKYLECYLKFGDEWPLSLVRIDVQKNDLMFTSVHLYDIYFSAKTHEDFIAWRHHRTFNDWQDDIYSMKDVEFQYHWPLIASALAEVNASS